MHLLENDENDNANEKEEQSSEAASTQPEDNSSQKSEINCCVLSNNTKVKTKAPQRKVKKQPSEAQLQVEEWVAYVMGHKRRPTKKAPTLISERRAEHSANKPLIWGKCEGSKTKLFLDSGAEVNVIDQDYFEELQKFSGNKILFTPRKGTIACANGSKITTHGIARLKLETGGSKADIIFTVAARVFPRVIVGIRGMKTMNIKLDPANSRAILGNGVTIPFISKVTPQSVWSGNGQGPSQGVVGSPTIPNRLQ
jgi:hypothetical protein